jgi:hypothetical protein
MFRKAPSISPEGGDKEKIEEEVKMVNNINF